LRAHEQDQGRGLHPPARQAQRRDLGELVERDAGGGDGEHGRGELRPRPQGSAERRTLEESDIATERGKAHARVARGGWAVAGEERRAVLEVDGLDAFVLLRRHISRDIASSRELWREPRLEMR
jgi:hypothetical protein